MKKKLYIRPLTMICIILIVLVSFIYPYKTGLMFNFKRITYSNETLVNEYFHLNIKNSSYINKCSIEKDSYFLDYVMDVKLVIPVEDIDSTFSYYNSIKKSSDEGQGWFGTQLFTDWGVDTTNFDYEYEIFETATRNGLFGSSKTQRSPIIVFTKPVSGSVTVYMFEDKLGWD